MKSIRKTKVVPGDPGRRRSADVAGGRGGYDEVIPRNLYGKECWLAGDRDRETSHSLCIAPAGGRGGRDP